MDLANLLEEMTYVSEECTEPDGNEMVTVGHATNGTRLRETAHRLMLTENGHCPWCGEDQ